MAVDDAIKSLQAAGANFECDRLIKILGTLGFDIRRGSGGNHYVVHHTQLADFFGSNFACMHGRRPQIRPVYVKKMVSIIETHKDELRQLYG